jgi:hypothetical protein
MTKVLTERVFNVPATQLTTTMKDMVYTDILRSLFFLRVAQLDLLMTSKSQNISTELKQALLKPLEIVRGCDQKVRAMIPEDKAEWLTRELSKEKVYDIGNLIEIAARVSGPEYEVVMELITDFLEKLLSAQRRGVRFNLKKYNAIFRFLHLELQAEDNGETSIHYDVPSDSITFKLSQPKPKHHATKS